MTTVRSELTERVKTLATMLSIQVAYEGNSFTKPANSAAFLEMFIIPANTMDVTVDGRRQRETGYMQINVWSKQGVGTMQGETIANTIKSAFPLVPKTGTVSIEATPTIKQGILDNSGYRIIPVVIPYRHEAEV